MAANLSGLFAQLNNTIAANPAAGITGENLLGQASQGLGGMMAGALGAPDRMKFMNPRAKMAEATQEIAQEDLTTIKGLAKAAQSAARAGDLAAAQAFAKQASAMRVAAARTGGPSIGTTSRTVRDESGNLYTPVTVTDKATGQPRTEYAAITPGAPPTPNGKVSLVSQTTGLSGTDTQMNRMELAQYKSGLNMTEAEQKAALDKGTITYRVYQELAAGRAEKWNDERDKMVSNIPTLQIQKMDVENALGLLETTSTGGMAARVSGLKDFFHLGDTSTTAELNQAMSKYVLDNLRSMGANPTEGERKFLIDSAANLSRGTEANVALFEKTLNRLNRNIEASNYLMDNPNASRDEYIKNYESIIGAGEGEEPRRRKWNEETGTLE